MPSSAINRQQVTSLAKGLTDFLEVGFDMIEDGLAV